MFDIAGVQHDDAVGHGHGFDLIVGDVDHRGLELLVQFGDFEPHVDAQRRVEVRQGLVEQEGLGFAHDGAADGDALALAAGQGAGLAIEIGGKVQRAGGVFDLAIDLGLRGFRHLEREGDVVAHAHMRIERVGLEHHGEAALGRWRVGDVLTIELDMA